MKRILIAAPASGSGKTTLTLGIMHALKRRGLQVAPFKVGPDFIDPGYHRLATGAASINLDAWMCPAPFVVDTFARHAAGSDVAVIEGVMGLFDGMDGASDAGSSAEIAKLVGATVVLVVDAARAARSAAALVHGFATFDPELSVGGVIFNNVASENHERILREAAAQLPGIRVIGCFPRAAALVLPSRHLGLVTAEDNPLEPAFWDGLATAVERHLDLEGLLALAAPADRTDRTAQTDRSDRTGAKDVRLAVARDAAFCFAYDDNLRLLQEAGAELVPFSPLADAALPPGISGIYLPGGYPELYREQLAANEALKEEIRQAIESGLPVYAECGGFIYLTRGVRDGKDLAPFAGVFPVATTMLPRRKALGYREVELTVDGLLGPAGLRARGHEFHYSEMEPMPPEVARIYRVTRKGVALDPEGFCYQNCLASYVHLHFGSSPAVAENFVGKCRAYQKRSGA
ncbi:cobyrinate a,c-diamide synthase [Geomesophilobacter sediminis]|uniref:Cobyrinate a,c-diamide synthase n=1 Tax=Geomesophilobacter sediminis TaxID=2798584 RepID=A0A8J7JC01_9BACT|nr:cobyrinate a,c-diamide synthase [Geomesophilobacter sediminis]MBJ6724776.1 cobyrinate a,c-diamide synthase [Geomesophilobacter sediminis]